MKKQSVFGLVGLIVLGAVAFQVVRSERPREVYAATVTYRLLSPTILASGTLAYEQWVTLVPEVPGRVLEILVREGDRVQQGQLLMRLDASPIYAELAELKVAAREAQLAIDRHTANMEAARRRMSRFDRLAASRLIDKSTLEQADSQSALAREELGASFAALDRTNAGIVEAGKRLAKMDIHSPVSGKVTAILIRVGETAVPRAAGSAGAGLATILGTGSLHADVKVSEAEMARVRVGQAAKVVPAAFPDEVWEGKVSAISLAPHEAPTARIHLASANADSFRPGMICRAEIAVDSEDSQPVLVVPAGAIRHEAPRNRGEMPEASVFVVDAGKARLRRVETGLADDRYIEIEHGLMEHDSVITGPSEILRFLREADPVTIVPRAAVKPS